MGSGSQDPTALWRSPAREDGDAMDKVGVDGLDAVFAGRRSCGALDPVRLLAGSEKTV
jgi:hypothetical protein